MESKESTSKNIFQNQRIDYSQSRSTNAYISEGVSTQTLQSDRINSVVLSPSKKYLVLMSDNKKIKLLDLDTGEISKNLEDETAYESPEIRISPNENYLAVSSRKYIDIWFLKGEPLKKERINDTGNIIYEKKGNFFWIDEECLVIARDDSKPWIFNASINKKDSEEEEKFQLKRFASHLLWCDENSIVTSSNFKDEENLEIYNRLNGEKIACIRNKLTQHPVKMKFSPNNPYQCVLFNEKMLWFVTFQSLNDEKIIELDPKDSLENFIQEGKDEKIVEAKFSLNGHFLFVKILGKEYFSSSRMVIWNIHNKKIESSLDNAALPTWYKEFFVQKDNRLLFWQRNKVFSFEFLLVDNEGKILPCRENDSFISNEKEEMAGKEEKNSDEKKDVFNKNTSITLGLINHSVTRGSKKEQKNQGKSSKSKEENESVEAPEENYGCKTTRCIVS